MEYGDKVIILSDGFGDIGYIWAVSSDGQAFFVKTQTIPNGAWYRYTEIRKVG